jgi:carboxylesterase
MWTWIIAGAAGVICAQFVSYRVRRRRVRDADTLRIPTGADAIVPGAHALTLRASRSHAALLLHGFGDTPQTLKLLAEYLHTTHGWSVRVPLLPGHGRSLRAFDGSYGDQWRRAAHEEYINLCSEYATVALVGLSMGGALATLEASRDAKLPALVLLAPYLTPPARAERLAPLANLIHLLIPYLTGGNRALSIFDPTARAESVGYGAVPPKRFRDLVSIAHDARFAAASVRAPTLLMHSRTDYRIPVPMAERHAALFTGASECAQQWLEGCGHVITVDYCRQCVWDATAAWLNRHAGAPTRDTAALR